jgi:hypothetical protein
MEQLVTSYELEPPQKSIVYSYIDEVHKHIFDMESTLNHIYINKLTMKTQYKDGQIIEFGKLEVAIRFLKDTNYKINNIIELINKTINIQCNGNEFALHNLIINNAVFLIHENYKEFVKYIQTPNADIIKDNSNVSTIYTCIYN